MSLFLCVDCGGSKTSAVISNPDGTILGRALGGPSNFAYLSLHQFILAVTEAVSDALKACSLPHTLPPSGPSPFAAASFGVSGVDSPSAVATITPSLSALLGIPPGPRLAVANDTHLLAAPVCLYPDVSHAVAVIAGTGSIAVSFREHSDGTIEELARIGGWGWILGDEGGGFSVGREAVRLILLEHDRASVTGAPPPESKLTQRVLARFGVSHVPEILPLVHLPDNLAAVGGDASAAPAATETTDAEAETRAHIRQAREKRLSSLAPLVFTAAFEDDDALALRILRSTASLLVDEIAVLLDPAAPRGVRASECVISFGGSLVGIDKYRAVILEDLERRGHVFKYVEFVDDAAAVGAKGLAAAARIAASAVRTA
ncbi:hypothetical protein H0H92_002096 [Tricholoma furcatifolium]|nr:hypothetical protein H0H92_002096 [Tricholoma furcatifolium]